MIFFAMYFNKNHLIVKRDTDCKAIVILIIDETYSFTDFQIVICINRLLLQEHIHTSST